MRALLSSRDHDSLTTPDAQPTSSADAVFRARFGERLSASVCRIAWPASEQPSSCRDLTDLARRGAVCDRALSCWLSKRIAVAPAFARFACVRIRPSMAAAAAEV